MRALKVDNNEINSSSNIRIVKIIENSAKCKVERFYKNRLSLKNIKILTKIRLLEKPTFINFKANSKIFI